MVIYFSNKVSIIKILQADNSANRLYEITLTVIRIIYQAASWVEYQAQRYSLSPCHLEHRLNMIATGEQQRQRHGFYNKHRGNLIQKFYQHEIEAIRMYQVDIHGSHCYD
jgi:hypothetical protein